MKQRNLPPELSRAAPGGGLTYNLDEQDVKYTEVFFCFIDILGYRHFLNKYGDSAPIFIYKLLKNTYESHIETYKSVSIKLLSDSILLWTDGNLPVHFWNLINVVELIRESFLENKMLLRGAITLGKNFISQDIIVSPALVETFETEKAADSPRILISESANRQAFEGLQKTDDDISFLSVGDYSRVVFPTRITKDTDSKFILSPFAETNGLCFLRSNLPSHYFTGDAYPTREQEQLFRKEGFDDLTKLKKQIKDIIYPLSEDPKVVKKHKYLVDSYNVWINQYLNEEEYEPFLITYTTEA